MKCADPKLIIQNVCAATGLELSRPVVYEAESSGYGAARFSIGRQNIVFRVARTTPKKNGQFVTIWKRNPDRTQIIPLDASDPIDFLIIYTSDRSHQGLFVFDKETTIERGIFSVSSVGGKRALRVYPPWSHPLAKEAIKSQEWQKKHFVHLSGTGGMDSTRMKELLRTEL